MTYRMDWFDETHRVLRVQFQDAITWDEFHVTVDEAHAKIRMQEHPVDLILWYTKGKLPRGNPVVQVQSVTKRQPKNTGQVVGYQPGVKPGDGQIFEHDPGYDPANPARQRQCSPGCQI